MPPRFKRSSPDTHVGQSLIILLIKDIIILGNCDGTMMRHDDIDGGDDDDGVGDDDGGVPFEDELPAVWLKFARN